MDDRQVRELVAAVETRLQEIEALADPRARDLAAAMVQSLVELYGEGLTRIVAELSRPGRDGALQALCEDELVSHLLLLHDLHPVAVEARVRHALDEVRPYLQSHGGNVELLGVEGGVARLRLQGSCHGCPASASTLELAIEEAIQKAAPDLQGIQAEGVVEPGAPPRGAPIQIGQAAALRPEGQAPQSAAAWIAVDGLASLSGSTAQTRVVAGEEVLFLRLAGHLYAYEPRCPRCQSPLGPDSLGGDELACRSCQARFDARRAGRCLDAPHLHLEPVPLLTSAEGAVKIALRGAVR